MEKLQRLKLHQELLDLSGLPCYFQPPENLKMEYPCIVYEKDGIHQSHADNRWYLGKDRYTLKLIHRDPDTDLPDKLLKHFQYISYGQRYKADNLYHDTLTIYY